MTSSILTPLSTMTAIASLPIAPAAAVDLSRDAFVVAHQALAAGTRQLIRANCSHQLVQRGADDPAVEHLVRDVAGADFAAKGDWTEVIFRLVEEA